MSIVIKDLTKVFGEQTAVDHINFSVNEGEILGFLGPNGAGKSTTMKIASCYLTPTGGTVEVSGYDVLKDSLEVRKRVGYLPENNPLYPDMYVKEYLGLIARIHKVAKVKERVGEMIGLTGLEREQGKKIGQLSKGYRQRVGLAQTMIHDPEVLIMDEPTSGLDPNQIIEIRQLIRDISKRKTVVLSTHIMQEVQALCDRVVIINRGKIVSDSTIGDLVSSGSGKKMIRIEFSEPADTALFENLPGLDKLETQDGKIIRITFNRDVDARAEIFRIASEHNLPVVGLTQEELSIENIFRDLTNTPEKEK
jgi:ABC-2 type transport system ATP-binding protein